MTHGLLPCADNDANGQNGGADASEIVLKRFPRRLREEGRRMGKANWFGHYTKGGTPCDDPIRDATTNSRHLLP